MSQSTVVSHPSRFLVRSSLGDYQAYWSEVENLPDYMSLASLTVKRREVIVASIPDLAVR